MVLQRFSLFFSLSFSLHPLSLGNSFEVHWYHPQSTPAVVSSPSTRHYFVTGSWFFVFRVSYVSFFTIKSLAVSVLLAHTVVVIGFPFCFKPAQLLKFRLIWNPSSKTSNKYLFVVLIFWNYCIQIRVKHSWRFFLWSYFQVDTLLCETIVRKLSELREFWCFSVEVCGFSIAEGKFTWDSSIIFS